MNSSCLRYFFLLPRKDILEEASKFIKTFNRKYMAAYIKLVIWDLRLVRISTVWLQFLYEIESGDVSAFGITECYWIYVYFGEYALFISG